MQSVTQRAWSWRRLHHVHSWQSGRANNSPRAVTRTSTSLHSAQPLQVLYLPSGSIVSAYQLHSGRRPLELRGHLGTINAACWCSRRRALLTGSNDRSVLVWAHARGQGDVCAAGDAASDASQDAWSEDEEGAPLDALDVGPRVRHGAGDAAPFSGNRQLPQVPRTGAAADARSGAGGAQAQDAQQQGWRPDRRLAPAHAWRRGGAGGQRQRGQVPTRRIQRIAARLIANLQQDHGVSGHTVQGEAEK